MVYLFIMSNKYYVTTPIYYVNDKPHVGHAYTTIAADVVARYNRLLGKEVFFITGTDEHGAKIAEAAAKKNQDPQAFCDELSLKFSDLWEKLNISHDFFIRTTDKQHETLAQKFLQELYDKGFIYKGNYKGLYCVGCESYKTESDLVDGLCPDHKKAPTELEEENYFFKLSAFNEELKTKITNNELVVRPESRKNELLGILNEGLHDIAISRKSVEWGIPLPFDSTQTTYVWIEALMNYVTAHKIFDDEALLNKWWPADVHFVGKDIVKFHALIWPAMLWAIGRAAPKEVFAHGFFTVDGTKMSKTLGNVIDPVEVSEKYSVDVFRYFVLSEFSFGSDGDIKLSRFGERYKSDLGDGIGNLASRVISIAAKLGSFTVDHSDSKEFVENSNAFWKKYHEKLPLFKFNEVLEDIRAYVQFCDRYVEANKPWELAKTDEAKLKKVLSNLLEAIAEIALALKPFMPETSEKLLHSLNLENIKFPQHAESEWGRASGLCELSKIEPLFPRIEE